MWPCQAGGTGPLARQCGATPASLWRRWCHHGHERECWLCPVHAKMIASGLGTCADCADRGVSTRAWLAPLRMIITGG
jgi:hypothetical protein